MWSSIEKVGRGVKSSWAKSKLQKVNSLRAWPLMKPLSVYKWCLFIKNWIIAQCNSRDLIGLVAVVYVLFYHAREIVTMKYCLLVVLAK